MTETSFPSETLTSDEVVIRDLTAADLPALEWDGEYRHFRKVFQNAFEEAQAGRRIMLGAFASDWMVGQVFVQLNSSDTRFADGCRRAYLYSLRVRYEYQRRGIGTRLIRAAEDRLRSLNFKAVTIAASKDNPGAQSLYERLGYLIFMQDPGQWSFHDPEGQLIRVEEPCWVMEKQLSNP